MAARNRLRFASTRLLPEGVAIFVQLLYRGSSLARAASSDERICRLKMSCGETSRGSDAVDAISKTADINCPSWPLRDRAHLVHCVRRAASSPRSAFRLKCGFLPAVCVVTGVPLD